MYFNPTGIYTQEQLIKLLEDNWKTILKNPRYTQESLTDSYIILKSKPFPGEHNINLFYRIAYNIQMDLYKEDKKEITNLSNYSYLQTELIDEEALQLKMQEEYYQDWLLNYLANILYEDLGEDFLVFTDYYLSDRKIKDIAQARQVTYRSCVNILSKCRQKILKINGINITEESLKYNLTELKKKHKRK